MTYLANIPHVPRRQSASIAPLPGRPANTPHAPDALSYWAQKRAEWNEPEVSLEERIMMGVLAILLSVLGWALVIWIVHALFTAATGFHSTLGDF